MLNLQLAGLPCAPGRSSELALTLAHGGSLSSLPTTAAPLPSSLRAVVLQLGYSAPISLAARPAPSVSLAELPAAPSIPNAQPSSICHGSCDLPSPSARELDVHLLARPCAQPNPPAQCVSLSRLLFSARVLRFAVATAVKSSESLNSPIVFWTVIDFMFVMVLTSAVPIRTCQLTDWPSYFLKSLVGRPRNLIYSSCWSLSHTVPISSDLA
jgi:hypothetical protein